MITIKYIPVELNKLPSAISNVSAQGALNELDYIIPDNMIICKYMKCANTEGYFIKEPTEDKDLILDNINNKSLRDLSNCKLACGQFINKHVYYTDKYIYIKKVYKPGYDEITEWSVIDNFIIKEYNIIKYKLEELLECSDIYSFLSNIQNFNYSIESDYISVYLSLPNFYNGPNIMIAELHITSLYK